MASAKEDSVLDKFVTNACNAIWSAGPNYATPCPGHHNHTPPLKGSKAHNDVTGGSKHPVAPLNMRTHKSTHIDADSELALQAAQILGSPRSEKEKHIVGSSNSTGSGEKVSDMSHVASERAGLGTSLPAALGNIDISEHRGPSSVNSKRTSVATITDEMSDGRGSTPPLVRKTSLPYFPIQRGDAEDFSLSNQQQQQQQQRKGSLMGSLTSFFGLYRSNSNVQPSSTDPATSGSSKELSNVTK
eukprot:Clim_evm21s34 gene=Clim_evmTU21s34